MTIEAMPETLEDAQKLLTEVDADRDKWKANSRKNEDRAKENVEAAKERDELRKKVEELEAAKADGLSEAEKAAKRLSDIEAALESEKEARKADSEARAAAEIKALRSRIGADKGLPAALFDRLTGDDEESITADADKLAELAPSGPKWPDTGAGKKGDGLASDDYIAAIDKALPDREAQT